MIVKSPSDRSTEAGGSALASPSLSLEQQCIGPNGGCAQCYHNPCTCREDDARRIAKIQKAHGAEVELLKCDDCDQFGVVADDVVRAYVCLKCGHQQKPKWTPSAPPADAALKGAQEEIAHLKAERDELYTGMLAAAKASGCVDADDGLFIEEVALNIADLKSQVAASTGLRDALKRLQRFDVYDKEFGGETSHPDGQYIRADDFSALLAVEEPAQSETKDQIQDARVSQTCGALTTGSTASSATSGAPSLVMTEMLDPDSHPTPSASALRALIEPKE